MTDAAPAEAQTDEGDHTRREIAAHKKLAVIVPKKNFEKVLRALLASDPLPLVQVSKTAWERRGLGALHDLDVEYRKKVKTAKKKLEKVSSDLDAIRETKRLLRGDR